MTRGYFITGTDTGVGKTAVAQALVAGFVRRGLRAACMKPVATGCTPTPHGLINDDATRLLALSNVPTPYERCNPYAFELPVAPHIAAQHTGRKIDLDHITASYSELAAHSDVVIVEGIGGWLVPLGENITVADIAAQLQLSVILVVGLRLGCLNHAALTSRAIVESKVHFSGWIANHCTPDFEFARENIEALRTLIAAPPLGEVSWQNKFDLCASTDQINLAMLQDTPPPS